MSDASLPEDGSFAVDGLTARIGEHTYAVIDISRHGLRLGTAEAIGPVDGLVTADLAVPLLGTMAVYRLQARIVWTGRKETGLAFDDSGETWRRIVRTLERRARPPGCPNRRRIGSGE